MDEKAKELAQALINSGKKSYIEIFTLERSEDRILVIVQRTDKERVSRLTEVVKAVSGPWGEPCPCCNGSGRM